MDVLARSPFDSSVRCPLGYIPHPRGRVLRVDEESGFAHGHVPQGLCDAFLDAPRRFGGRVPHRCIRNELLGHPGAPGDRRVLSEDGVEFLPFRRRSAACLLRRVTNVAISVSVETPILTLSDRRTSSNGVFTSWSCAPSKWSSPAILPAAWAMVSVSIWGRCPRAGAQHAEPAPGGLSYLLRGYRAMIACRCNMELTCLYTPITQQCC